MRILITTDVAGGVWDHTVTLARELVDRGHAVRVAVLAADESRRTNELPGAVRAEAAPFRLEWQPGGLADVAPAAAWIRRLAREHRADVVHLNQYAYAAWDLGTPTLVGAHSDVVSWWWCVHRGDPPEEWSAYRGAVQRGLMAAGMLVSPTVYQSELMRRHYGRAADRVVWNGVAPPGSGGEPARDPATKAASDPALEPARDPPFLVCVGRAWDPAKGLATLEAALDLLGHDAPDVHVVGPPRGPDGQLFVSSRLILHGPKPRAAVDGLLARAGIYVAPSLYEPFGLAPLEAALQGCALVLSDIGSFRELWHGCAVFFPPGDAAGLAGAARSLIDDPVRRTELARRAGLRARQRYTPGRMAAAYEEAYADLLSASDREIVCA